MTRTLQVRCLVCGEMLCYNRECTEPLLDHLKVKHPYIQVAKFPAYPEINRLDKKPSQEDKRHENLNHTKGKPKNNNFAAQFPFQTGKVLCPSCGKKGGPIIRRQKNQIGDSALGTCFTLGCWPLCFLPFFVFGNRIVNLYCPFCSYFMGTFDRKLSLMITRSKSDQTIIETEKKFSKSSSEPNIVHHN